MMKQIPILKWAAGAAISIPDDVEFDTSNLLHLVRVHNLAGRFMRRIQESQVRWVTPELVEGLKHLHINTKQQVARNINAICELDRQLSNETRIILIKGVSTYILSEQEAIMRAGDIDLFSNNPVEVVQTLLNLGYTQTRVPFMHEIGEYTKATTEFDIHDHFPVYSYSQALFESDLMPRHHTRVWQQDYQLQHKKITFEDLVRYAHRSRQPDNRCVIVPDPNLSAIIICAHAFMNYTNMWSISHREKAYVRLSEIADLFNLAAHSSFKEELFLSYVSHYQAGDAVEWAASVAVSVFGKNPLPVLVNLKIGDRLPASRFPRCLWWNFWANLSSDSDDLLQTWWFSTEWLTEQLGGNHCSIRDGQTAIQATVSVEDAVPLTRYITQSSEPIPILLQIKKAENGMVIYLQVGTPFQVDIERVRVESGKMAREWIYTVNDNQQMIAGVPVASSFVRNDTGYKLTMEFAWETLGLSNPTGGTISLLIGVARQTNSEGLIGSILIPLMIEF